jgi:hypothetical protein
VSTDSTRRTDRHAASSPSRRATIAALVILGATLISIGVITMTPAAESIRLPFWCFRCGSRPGIDVLLNILMFVPIGVGLGLLRVRARWVVVCVLSATLAVEALQFALIPGRFASARDIFANTIGGLTGWQVALAWRSLVAPSPSRAFTLSVAAASVWVAIQLFTAWAMAIVAPPPPWWAQIRLRDLGFPAVFGGNVVRLSLGTIPIRYSDQLEESAAVRSQLLDGAAMNAVVTGVEPSAGPAPIFLLATDDTLSEIAALVQTGEDVFFRVRTRAAMVGLRNPSLRLGGAFPRGSARDTVTLSARYADGRYRLESTRPGEHVERTLAASPSWAWALLMPIPHYSFGREVRWLTAGWLFTALGLVGFWSAQAADRSVADPRGARRRAMLPAAVAIIAGLALTPVAFGLPVSHWSEWAAELAGSACGWHLGSHLLRRAIANDGAPASIH